MAICNDEDMSCFFIKVFNPWNLSTGLSLCHWPSFSLYVNVPVTPLIFGGGGKWKNGIFVTQIFSTGKDKYRVEFFKSMADDFGLSQQGKGKQKPMKVVKNVQGQMLYSTLKKYLGI